MIYWTSIIFVLLMGVHSEAKQIKAKALESKFFYSLPAEASSEWAYLIPECTPMTETQKTVTKTCAPFKEHESCHTNKKVKLSNALTNKKKKFDLIYHVFSSKEKCIQDRDTLLSSEE